MRYFPLLLAFCFTAQLGAQAKLDSLSKIKIHEFDYWLGEWDVYKTGTDTIVGHSLIESLMDSLGLQENYKSLCFPYRGTSLNKYNFRLKQWEQFYIDNSGSTIHLQGGLVSGNMVLQNDVETAKGKVENKISWYKHPDGSVRQVWTQQYGDAPEWKAVFDGTYRRKKTEK